MSRNRAPVLRLGVTGHRSDRIPAEAAGRLAEALRSLLLQIGRALPPASSGERPAMGLVAGLADGADLIAAETAIGLGLDLHAVLPTAAQLHARHLPTAESAKTFRWLLARASQVDELSASSEEAAHAAVARLILRHAHILIAVWDGEEGRGQGGTADVVARAIAKDKPVIWMDPNGVRPADLLRPRGRGQLPEGAGLEAAAFAAALARIVQASAGGRGGCGRLSWRRPAGRPRDPRTVPP